MWTQIQHKSECPNDWGLVDMSYRLRMRSFLRLCIAPLFDRLESEFSISNMRERGISRVIYYADFERKDVAVAHGEPLRVDHALRMHEAISDRAGNPVRGENGSKRLLWHSVNQITCKTPPATAIGGGAGTSSHRLAGTLVGEGRAIHVLTRPTAPKGERSVTEVPRELSGLQLHSWDELFPTVDSVCERPGNSEPSGCAFEFLHHDVWGLANTDIKQHVNVLEYIMGVENQVSRHLDQAGLDVGSTGIRRLRILFRRPFFAGEKYLLRSRLFFAEQETRLLVGFHQSDKQGRWSQRPGVCAAVEVARVETDADQL